MRLRGDPERGGEQRGNDSERESHVFPRAHSRTIVNDGGTPLRAPGGSRSFRT